MLSRRAVKVLRTMIEAENAGEYDEAEIVCEGRTCWLGVERLSRKMINSLVQHVAISHVSEPGSLERYTINGTGRKIAEDPSVADRVLKGLLRGEAMDETGAAINGPPKP
ncbi:hypothetical protein HFO56_33225 [Rhizobium laguerreae]|uniref:hypothetical protein n=1 Tax=Rhizobium laguerreae TaxID=1076926 RepID=UPI001C9044DB|nr:hypothetical protein [Rhizobium laguerreae]MBY3157188.1 hypothetical protein [Rhizobium laguerreae]